MALIAGNGILADRRRLLEVPQGRRGLRQAEAVFQHVKNLPQLLEEVLPLPRHNWSGSQQQAQIGARVIHAGLFKTGEGMARALALAWGASLYLTSHQVGHIWAGLFGRGSKK